MLSKYDYMSVEINFCKGRGMQTNEVLVLERLCLLLTVSEPLGERSILLGQVNHAWIRDVIATVPFLKDGAEIKSILKRNPLRLRVFQIAGPMLQMLKAERKILHPPVNPVLIKPVANELKKAKQHFLLNVVISRLDLLISDFQQICSRVHKEARRLARCKVHYCNRCNPR